MARTIQKSLDMSPGFVPPVIRVSQYDSDFTIVFTLYSSFGDFTLASETTAEVRGTKRSGTGYSANATINTSNKTVTVSGNNQMTAVSGKNIYEIVLFRNGKQLSSANFILLCEPAALDANTIVDESVIKEFTHIEEDVQAAKDAANRAEAAAESVGRPTDQQAQNAVNNWLNEHPEATTTVQDGSITEVKLFDALKLKTIKDYVTPQMFGAKGDGVTDDTLALNEAFSHPMVYVPYGVYRITDIIMTTSKKIACEKGSTINYDGESVAAVLASTGGSIEIDGLIIDGNLKAAKGISIVAGSPVDFIIIKNCVCKNFDNGGVSVSSCGIYALRRAQHVEISGCTVENVQRTTGSAGSIASVGIAVLNIDGNCEISNNYIVGVYFDQNVKTDADGIQAFSYDTLTQNVKSISVEISNNVITQCQGRFIKCQCDNVVVSNNTMVNSGIELIDNFRGVDLQIGKGEITGNRINVSGRLTENIATSALLAWTARSYTVNFAQCTVKNNDLVNDVKGGYGLLLNPIDMKTTVIVDGNNLSNFIFGADFANTGELTGPISVIVCGNWFDNVEHGFRVRNASANITKIIENNYGYIYPENKINTALGQHFEITASTFKEFCKATYEKFTGVGNYICQSFWKTHSTFACVVSIYSATAGTALFFSSGYIYVYLKYGNTEILYKYNNDEQS